MVCQSFCSPSGSLGGKNSNEIVGATIELGSSELDEVRAVSADNLPPGDLGSGSIHEASFTEYLNLALVADEKIHTLDFAICLVARRATYVIGIADSAHNQP